MVKIVIENLAQKELLEVDPSKSLLEVVQDHFIDWMHACGGKGRCTTCKMIVVEGLSQLSRLTSAEIRYRDLGQLAENERMACQARVLGSCRIRIPEESKMPHMEYTF